MELREAIERVRDTSEEANLSFWMGELDEAMSVIMNAVVDGTLIPAAEITALRERLEQAERERDEAEKTVLMTDYMAGFREGIEAAAGWHIDRSVACLDYNTAMTHETYAEIIRALSPTDNTTPVAEAETHLHDIINCGNCSGSRQSARLALRALAAQTGG